MTSLYQFCECYAKSQDLEWACMIGKEIYKIRDSFVQDMFVHNSSAKWSALHFF